MTARRLVIAIVISASTSTAAAQPPARPPSTPPQLLWQSAPVPAGDSTIQGRVIDRESRRELEGVLVQLASSDRRVLMTQTGANGAYAFEGIAAGEYRVMVRHDGYVDQTSGVSEALMADMVPLASVRLERGTRRDVDFALVRAAAIAGRVAGDDGRPLGGALVSLGMSLENGGMRWVGQWSTRTNTAGEYTIGNIPPGDYRVSANWTDPETAKSTRNLRMRNIHYPGTENLLEATPVRAYAGRVTGGINITIPARELLRIQGKLIRGSVDAPIEAHLILSGSLQSIAVADDGSFSTPRLPAGRYTLVARAKGDESSEAAALSVDLTTELTDIVLGLMPTGVMSGRVVTDEGTPPPDTMQVAAVLADQGKEIDHFRRDRVDTGHDGTFELRDLFGERIVRVVGFTDGWDVDQVLIGRKPVTSVTMDSGGRIDDVRIVLTRKRE